MEGVTMQAVGLYLRSLRDEAGYTQQEAADLVGSVAKTVERWEAGKHEPKVTELSAYVKAIGGSVQKMVSLLLDMSEGEAKPTFQLSERHQAILSQMSPEELDTLIAFVEQTRQRRKGDQ
jgi:DNA-binding XRE family transcriptional regulator